MSNVQTQGTSVYVGVRLERLTQTRIYLLSHIAVKVGDIVVIEEEKCLESGVVIRPPQEIEKSTVVSDGSILRVADSEDRIVILKNGISARQALFQSKIQVERRGLPMNLFHARYSFDRTRLTFQFTSEGRVDFRELLKDLAAMFKARIELRQVGAREETRVIGGFGPCGRHTCCSRFLTELNPVSIKMAKDQGLHQNPNKVTGLCGKLMCCLKYEVDFYRNTLSAYPPVDSFAVGENIQGIIIHQNPVKGTVTLNVSQGVTVEIPISSLKSFKPPVNTRGHGGGIGSQ